jgi:hypothetical protein
VTSPISSRGTPEALSAAIVCARSRASLAAAHAEVDRESATELGGEIADDQDFIAACVGAAVGLANVSLEPSVDRGPEPAGQ